MFGIKLIRREIISDTHLISVKHGRQTIDAGPRHLRDSDMLTSVEYNVWRRRDSNPPAFAQKSGAM